MLEHGQPIRMLQVLVQPHPVPNLAQDAGQRGLTHFKGLSAQVLTVKFQQIKGVQERLGLILTAAEDIKPGQPTLITAHHLAVDQTGPHLQVVHGFDHQREAVGPVITSPGDKPDADCISTRHQPVAVVLDLVNPTGPRRRMVGRGWQAGLDEACPAGLQQHVNLDSEQLRRSRDAASVDRL